MRGEGHEMYCAFGIVVYAGGTTFLMMATGHRLRTLKLMAHRASLRFDFGYEFCEHLSRVKADASGQSGVAPSSTTKTEVSLVLSSRKVTNSSEDWVTDNSEDDSSTLNYNPSPG